MPPHAAYAEALRRAQAAKHQSLASLRHHDAVPRRRPQQRAHGRLRGTENQRHVRARRHGAPCAMRRACDAPLSPPFSPPNVYANSPSSPHSSFLRQSTAVTQALQCTRRSLRARPQLWQSRGKTRPPPRRQPPCASFAAARHAAMRAWLS